LTPHNTFHDLLPSLAANGLALTIHKLIALPARGTEARNVSKRQKRRRRFGALCPTMAIPAAQWPKIHSTQPRLAAAHLLVVEGLDGAFELASLVVSDFGFDQILFSPQSQALDHHGVMRRKCHGKEQFGLAAAVFGTRHNSPVPASA
jgi:hypothetical protein